MKLSFAILLSAVSSVVARTRSIPIAQDGLAADSELGMKILSQARLLEGGQNEAAVDYTWVSGYSLKFQGCHNTQQVSHTSCSCFCCSVVLGLAN
jgi:hypothetical protein